MNILQMTDSVVDSVLANFDAPGKIDLVNFIQRNLCLICPWKN